MPGVIRGAVRVDKKTKNLVKRLQPGEIALIDHEELDEVCAKALVESRVRAVINAASSLSRSYPNVGPITLIEAGICLIDSVGQEIFEYVKEEDVVEITGNVVSLPGGLAGNRNGS